MANEVRKVLATSMGPASMRIFQNYMVKVCQSALNADSKIRAGRNIKSMNDGSNCMKTLVTADSFYT